MCVFFPPSQPRSLFLVQGVGGPGQCFCPLLLWIFPFLPPAALRQQDASTGSCPCSTPPFSEPLTFHFHLLSPLLWCCCSSFWRLRGVSPAPSSPSGHQDRHRRAVSTGPVPLPAVVTELPLTLICRKDSITLTSHEL